MKSSGLIPASPNGDYLYEFQYLDLVDSSNGNAYVTLGDSPTIDLYWPVPDDADTSAPFYIVHFDALDRDYEGAADEQLKENPAEKLDGTLVTLNGKQYIKFATGSFSPSRWSIRRSPAAGTTAAVVAPPTTPCAMRAMAAPNTRGGAAAVFCGEVEKGAVGG